MRVSISINISLLRSAGRSAGEGQALTAKFLPALRAKPTLKTGQGISLPGSKCVVPDETKVFLWRGQRDPFNRRTDPQVSAANCAASLCSTSFRWRVSLDAMGGYEFVVTARPARLCSETGESSTQRRRRNQVNLRCWKCSAGLRATSSSCRCRRTNCRRAQLPAGGSRF